MPEVKNIFLKGKMNQDIDKRLLQNGEYIEARNVSINDSSNGSAGSLENVPGNTRVTDFGVTGINLDIIGFYVDRAKERIFAFITDWNDTSSNQLSYFAPATSNHYIVVYNTVTKVASTLVSGNFLNFSKTHPILGINVLEDILFFTDNRNQPRKINIDLALANPSYYDKEETISILKYFPWNAPRLVKLTGDGDLLVNSELLITTNDTSMVDGTYLGVTGSASPSGSGATFNITVLGGSVTEIKVASAGSNYAIGNTISFSVASGSVVATILTENMNQDATMKDCVSETLPINTIALATATTGSPTTSITVSTSLSAIYAGATITGLTAVASDAITISNSFTGGTSIPINNPNGLTLSGTPYNITIGANPYHDPDFDGDVDYLSDKFVKFSYRFKFEDGEHSLIAPFSQAAFIPRQDGYFMDTTYPTDVNVDGSDENNAIRSTIISFFENKVNCMDLVIDMPEGINNVGDLYDELKVEAIEIIYKQSDQTSLKIVNVIEKDELVGITGTQYSFTYKSDAPIRTLPQDEITRAADKAPIKAQSQEVTGNRVIYGNYIARSARPKTLNYQLLVGEKNDIGENNSLNKIEYPNHTLKQNRSYKVGIVLCDKFGRQSDVITSNNCTINNQYRGDVPMYSNSDIYSGDSLKIVFNSEIPSIIDSVGYVGLYNQTNPTGWYSYKVVVQQKEQDYYNIYLPTILNNYPKNGTEVLSDNVAFVTLFSDNVNKAPRDLKEVGPQDIMYSSSVEMYPRVDNDVFSLTLAKNKQFFPDKLPDKIVRIGLRNDIGLDKDIDGNAYTDSPFYGIPDISQKGSNPFIGEVSTRKQIGNSGGYSSITTNQVSYKNTKLNVYETTPFESNLDIYYETGTCGLISELNTFISNSASQYAAVNVGSFTFTGKESATPGSNMSTTFYPVNSAGVDISGANMSGQLISVVNASGTDVTSDFTLYRDSITYDYNVRSATGKYFVFDNTSVSKNNYKFTMRFTDTTSGTVINDVIIDFPNQLTNVSPSFVGTSPFAPSGTFLENTANANPTNVLVLDGKNGTASTDPDLYKRQLLWTVDLVEFYWQGAGQWEEYPNWQQYFRFFKDTVAQTYDQAAETLQYYNQLACLNTVAINPENWYDSNNRRDTDFRVHLKLYDANGSGLSTTARVDFTLTRYNS